MTMSKERPGIARTITDVNLLRQSTIESTASSHSPTLGKALRCQAGLKPLEQHTSDNRPGNRRQQGRNALSSSNCGMEENEKLQIRQHDATSHPPTHPILVTHADAVPTRSKKSLRLPQPFPPSRPACAKRSIATRRITVDLGYEVQS